MAYEITNLYQELGISTTTTKVEDIQAAIDTQIKSWQQRVNNPKYKLEAPAHTAALKKLKTEVQTNPAIIKQHAAAYVEIEKRERIQKEKIIRTEGNIYVQNGEIPKENLTILVNKTKLSEQEILKILGARVKEARKKLNLDYEDDGVPELDRVTMGKIETNLKPLTSTKNLYDFLGVKQNSSTVELSSHLAAITKLVSEDPHKTDPVVSAKKALCDLCRDILINPNKRKSYDKALANSSFAPIGEMIRNLKAGSPFMSGPVYKKLIDEATKLGIPLGKAKHLIYQTADSIGLPIAADDVTQNMVQCRFCYALNEEKSANCRSCGMPIIVVCPNCGKTSEGDELACKCGFIFSDMMRAPEYIKQTEAALTLLDYSSASDCIKKLESIWKTHPQLVSLKRKCGEIEQLLKAKLESVEGLCEKKLYYKARTAIASMGSSPQVTQVRAEIDSAIDLAEKQLIAVSQIKDANTCIDKYMQILSICADCEKAKIAIESNPPTAPSNLVSEITGSSIRIKWNKLNSQFIEYHIIRKENGRPTSIKDGVHLADTSNAQFDDTNVKPGVSYFYAIYSKCGEIFSRTGLNSDKPAFVVCDIDINNISYDIQEKSIGFNIVLPQHAKAIEIHRDNKLIDTIYGSSYMDSGLVANHEYIYKFITVFEDCQSVCHKSNGVTRRLKPITPPKPVSLKLEDGVNEAKLSWTLPEKGTLAIYVSDKPLTFHENDIVNLDIIKLPKLNITGNYCTITKNFSGERFYLPVTIKENVAVIGNIVSVVAVSPLKDVKIELADKNININWNWEGTPAVRISCLFDGLPPMIKDIFASRTEKSYYQISVPNNAKTAEVKVMSLVLSSDKKILGSPAEKVFSLKPSSVTFEEVSNKKKYAFITTDEYVIKIKAETSLPCDLHLLVKEQSVPVNLVNYTPTLIIKKSDIKPNVVSEFSFNYNRKLKGQIVYFRLIAADRSFSKQIRITPETRSLK